MQSGPQPLLSRKAPTALSFADYRFNLTRGALQRGDEDVKLRPKSYEALKYLVENAGRLVPKAELIAVLWPDAAAVSEDSLTHCIMDIRRALGDGGQQIVRTVPGRGYLFSADVHPCDEPVAADPAPVRHARARGIPKPAIVGAALGLAALGGLGWFLKTRADRKWAHASLPRIEELAAAGKYPEAYELAKRILDRLPAEPNVIGLMSELSDDLSVTTVPPGAEVYLRHLGSARAERIGVTPIDHLRIARAESILSIRKAGYPPSERTVSSALRRATLIDKEPWKIRIRHDFRVTTNLQRDMALIPGGEYRLRSYSRPTEANVKLADYLIDRFEVSNRDFKEFVEGGGYRNPRLWGSAFAEAHVDGAGLKDRTGLSAPRGWIGATFPAGQEMYPVTGITWHEARAYCRFRGKDLPTVFEWEKAARPPEWAPFGLVFPWGLLDPITVSKRANLDSSGLAPVDSFEFGMSPDGVYNLAGNAAEWVRNRYDDGYAVAGGAWNEPIYRFLYYGSRPALYSSDTIGCRCALHIGPDTQDEGGTQLSSSGEILRYPISNDREFRISAARYEYERTPLHAVVLTSEDRGPWRREEITFDGQGGQRAKAFLYLPKNARPPYQVIHYLSGAAWWAGVPMTDVVESSGGRLAPYLRSGRAVFLVVLDGFAGREAGKYANLEFTSEEYRPVLTNWLVDMRRGVDYLETRADVDSRKIAFWNDSTAQLGLIVAALNQRYSAVILVGIGARPKLVGLPAANNPYYFAPHIRAPKLMLNGRYDDLTPERTSVKPLFELLQPPKKSVRFEGGHMPPPEVAVPIINPFLDETLGPVRR